MQQASNYEGLTRFRIRGQAADRDIVYVPYHTSTCVYEGTSESDRAMLWQRQNMKARVHQQYSRFFRRSS